MRSPWTSAGRCGCASAIASQVPAKFHSTLIGPPVVVILWVGSLPAMAEGDGSRRGGSQWIPRPPGTRDGDRPDWVHLDPADRRFSLAVVRDRLVAHPPPRAAERATP